MKILLDAQLPPALVRFLEASGHSAKHLQAVGLRHASDTLIWDYLLHEGLVLFTKDEDFASRRLHAEHGPQVVWLRFGNCSTPELRRHLTPLLATIELRVSRGDAVVEVREA